MPQLLRQRSQVKLEPMNPLSDPVASTTPHRIEQSSTQPQSQSSSRSWLILALASGAFAALNGAFAKMTTTTTTANNNLTSNLKGPIYDSLLLLPFLTPSTIRVILDLASRAFFLGLNILSNGIMWGLFTRALTGHPSSATQVSIVNTSANFLVTALLGGFVFGERLGPLWWVGAAFLVLGNVIIGRQDGKGAEGEESEGIVDSNYVDGAGVSGIGRGVDDVMVTASEVQTSDTTRRRKAT